MSQADGFRRRPAPELVALRNKVRQVLAMYYPRHQNTRDNSPWEVMHAIIAYGVDTQLFKDGPTGEKVNAIGWTCYNYPLRNEQMLFVNRGKLDARRGPGLQGHYGQFLAILAQSHLKSDYPLYVQGKSFTLADLIEHEKATCVAGEELTFKLIALMHYLDSDETWTSQDGQEWSIQKLVREELKQPIRGAACGGTHRLMGFSYAVNKRIQRGKPVVGQFERARVFVQDYHRYTFSLQNADGSFSTEWFVRRGDSPDIDRRLKTSGHILEWIGFSVSDEELRDPRMIKAVDYVATILLEQRAATPGKLARWATDCTPWRSTTPACSRAEPAWQQEIVSEATSPRTVIAREARRPSEDRIIGFVPPVDRQAARGKRATSTHGVSMNVPRRAAPIRATLHRVAVGVAPRTKCLTIACRRVDAGRVFSAFSARGGRATDRPHAPRRICGPFRALRMAA